MIGISGANYGTHPFGDVGTWHNSPAFALPEPNGNIVRSTDFSGQPLLVAFICNHCPYVIHIQTAFTALANTLCERGIAVVAISANDAAGYSQDGPDEMAKLALHYGYQFPYLYDQSQATAQAYQAVCTPDFYLFDATHTLVYRGQFDASRPGNKVAVSGCDLRVAADAVLNGLPVSDAQQPSVGCGIKWKPGNEPVL